MRIRVDHYIHIKDSGRSRMEQQLELILRKLSILDRKADEEMADLTALTTEVTENAEVIDSAVTLINGLAQQIRDLSTDPAALQALADQLDSQSGELAEAVAANTVTPEPEPTPDEG